MANPEFSEFQLVGPAEPKKPPRQLGTRTKARQRALDLLFEADLKGIDPVALLEERLADAETIPVREFSAELVRGVAEHRRAIDARIASSLAEGWSLPRLPRIDRVMMRIAVYEIEYTDLDDRIAISEAVILVDHLSTDDSPTFVNGVLARISEDKPTSV